MPENKTIEELQEDYDLELDKVIKTIKKEKAGKILLQFPDGMKPYALTVKNYLQNKTNKEFFIWLGTCFGACDIPKVEEVDLIVQFGHSGWGYDNEEIEEL